MKISALINELEALHVVLSLDGDNLRVSAPKGTLSDALKARILAERDVLTELLKNTQGSRRASEPVEPQAAGGPEPAHPRSASALVPRPTEPGARS